MALARVLTEEERKMAETYCPGLLQMFDKLRNAHYVMKCRNKELREVRLTRKESKWVRQARHEIALEMCDDLKDDLIERYVDGD